MTTVELDDVETAQKIMRMVEALEENDDVQQVYTNFDVTDAVAAALAEANDAVRGAVRVLGVDPGTHVTGWVSSTPADGTSSTSTTGPSARHEGPALGAPRPDLRRARRGHGAHGPEALALERAFVSENPQSALKLGHARGVIMLAAVRGGLEVAEYTPGAIKSAVTGSGRRRQAPGRPDGARHPRAPRGGGGRRLRRPRRRHLPRQCGVPRAPPGEGGAR